MPQRDEAPDVVRIVEGVSGRVPMHGVLRLRFDYGRVVPWVRRVDGQLVAVAGPDSVWLRSTPAPLDGRDFATHSEFTVSAGRAGAVRADLAPVLAADARSRSTRTRRWTRPRPGGPSGWPAATTTAAGRARSAAR